MNNRNVLNNNLIDLKVGIDLAENFDNTSLKTYSQDRVKKVMGYLDVCDFISNNLLVDSYVVDLVLFVRLSILFGDLESKDYFKGRLIDLINVYPDLNSRDDIKEVL